jgi:hypothetical protein
VLFVIKSFQNLVGDKLDNSLCCLEVITRCYSYSSPFKVLSVINLLIVYTVYKTPEVLLGLWTDLTTSDTSRCLINSINYYQVYHRQEWTDMITSNTSRWLINSINYYQVYHRQHFERTWLRVTPRGDL